MTRRVALIVSLVGLHGLVGSPAPAAQVAAERLVLETVRGNIVLALYPDIAPRHVAQIQTLVRLGAYDGTHFHRVEPGFVIQLSDVSQRQEPLSAPQSAANRRLPRELAPGVRHGKGTVSMARGRDPGSATSSISILLDAAPHLDGEYTIVGHVESGADTINAIAASELGRGHAPRERISVTRAYLEADPGSYYQTHAWTPADLIGTELKRITADEASEARRFFVNAMIGIIAVALLGFALFERLDRTWLVSLLMIQALVATFALFILLAPAGRLFSPLAVVIFFGLVGLFKFMNRFESKAHERREAARD